MVAALEQHNDLLIVGPSPAIGATALQAQHERICETHPPEWAERTAAIAATWDVDTIVGLIRDDFNRAMAAATG